MSIRDMWFNLYEINDHDDSYRPRRQTNGSAGYDLKACIRTQEAITLWPKTSMLFGTNYKLGMHRSLTGMILPRSSLAAKYGVTVANAPGLIDADYQGELKVLLINHSDKPFIVEDGMRIAQLVVLPVVFDIDDDPVIHPRNDGGFGSTGA